MVAAFGHDVATTVTPAPRRRHRNRPSGGAILTGCVTSHPVRTAMAKDAGQGRGGSNPVRWDARLVGGSLNPHTLVLSQAEMAARLGISRQALVGLESGAFGPAAGTSLRILANLGIVLTAFPAEAAAVPQTALGLRAPRA
jgi:DNA-binding XRE family transcriptional regulator